MTILIEVQILNLEHPTNNQNQEFLLSGKEHTIQSLVNFFASTPIMPCLTTQTAVSFLF